LIGYPAVFYLPETRWGIGAGASYNFYINKQDSVSPPSQIQLGIGYTQNNQKLIYLPYDLYWKERKHSLSGEIGYYDYSYYFYGVGPGNESGKRELYDVRFPRFRINYLRKIRDRFFVGARWWYEDYDVYNLAENAWLSNDSILGGTGNRTSGPGLVALWDNRDNIYFTLKGTYLEFVVHNQEKIWGSEFGYTRYRIDYRWFLQTAEKQALGLHAFGDVIVGNVPFSQMPAAGNIKRMRGYYEGRYRDRNALIFETEYRGYFWRRWGATAFFNYAFLANSLSNFNLKQDYASAGAGLRFAFDKEKRINIRLDAALPIGDKQNPEKNLISKTLIYFTIGEAF
jgi:hypothetical protein